MSRGCEMGSWLSCCLLFAGCAYPHLDMGVGVAGGQGTSMDRTFTASSKARSGIGGTDPGLVRSSDGGTRASDPTRANASELAVGGNVSTDDSVAVGGNVATSSGAGGVASGGVTGSGTTMTATSIGGTLGTTTPVVVQGGTLATSSSTATSVVTTGNCDESTNLLDYLSDQWIGGDPDASLDDPCGVQGSVYAFGDAGIDGEACTADDAIRSPECVTSGQYRPCANGRCCISGVTSADPDADVWGAGIGLFLHMDPSGTPTRYTGQARGFVVRLSGAVNGQPITLFYVQDEDEPSSPFVSIDVPGATRVPFLEVSCHGDEQCAPPTPNPTLLQLFLAGGVEGEFELCIERITPIF